MEKERLKKELDHMGLLVRKFETWADERPQKTFFYYGEADRHYTYDEFNNMCNRIANNLQRMGVAKGDRVALFLKNPLVTILSMFALWKLGAVFCPANFLYKGRLLSYQLNDTDPTLLILENGREPLLNDIKDQIKCRRVALYRPEAGQHDFDPEAARFKLDSVFEVTPFFRTPHRKRRQSRGGTSITGTRPISSTPPAPPGLPREWCSPIAGCRITVSTGSNYCIRKTWSTVTSPSTMWAGPSPWWAGPPGGVAPWRCGTGSAQRISGDGSTQAAPATPCCWMWSCPGS